MNSLPLRRGYVCRSCVQNLSRQSPSLLARGQLRPQTTDASQDAPNAKLRIQKHWNGDAKAKFRETPPTESSLHMSKTQMDFRLELNGDQKPSTSEGDPFPSRSRPLSMRERRQRRREGALRQTAISVNPDHLPERLKRQMQSQLESEASAEIVDEDQSLERSAPQIPTPKVSTSSHKYPQPTIPIKKDTGHNWRIVQSDGQLQPSAPSPSLARKRQVEPAPPSIKPEAPLSYVKLHFSKLEDFNWYWESYPPTITQKTRANHFFTNHGRNAKLLRSVAQFRKFPESDVPEVAFVGRSNVGKSSLLNAVVNADIKALLARTSSTPGFTKTMNLYGMGPGVGVNIKAGSSGHDRIEGLGGLTIVDMPGYGEGSLSSWGVEIMKYIQGRKQLRRVFVLLDAEHGIKDKDRSLLASLRLSGVSHQVILSKLDKLYIPKSKDIKRFDGKAPKRGRPKGSPEKLRLTMEKLKSEIQPPFGGGALGEILGLVAKALLDDEEAAHSLILTDIIEPPIPSNVHASSHARAKTIKADLCTESSTVVTKDIDAVYVFHGIMSSGAEADFDLGMSANFDATRSLLEALRHTSPGARVIYASSQAVYNNSVTLPVTESQLPTPETSYGAEKMMCEYLITEYTRRGFIDGISLRFPTVSVRPGKPTAAASTKFDINRLAKYDRCINFPGIGVSVQDMMDSLERVGGADKLALLEMKEEPALKKILYSWPAEFNNTKALELGFVRDEGFDRVVRDYVDGMVKGERSGGKTVNGRSDGVRVGAIEVAV
ncbi:nucleoside-diphosphate-sugar epimerase [Stemphylium lycopersici]|nr:nucleoside-diphosphate-sugar epimerase [Stemphylium lycopersici]